MAPKWEKIGHVYVPNGEKEWMSSHASNTVPIHMYESIFRVYFSSRDLEGRSHISYVDLDLGANEINVIAEAKNPVLCPGSPGFFDESGVSLSCITKSDSGFYLYYLGWTLGKTVPWYNSIGVAEMSLEGEIAKKLFKSPIYSRSESDPISLSYPFLIDIDGEKMVYYGSNRSWGESTFDMDHVLKIGRSKSGMEIEPLGRIAIVPREGEYAFSRPYVFQNSHGSWSMYYSYRGEVYKIGYAESEDGLTWKRMDEEVGIGPSESGWDSEMICYPCLFDFEGKRYMTYNGNEYGKTGFGIAVEED